MADTETLNAATATIAAMEYVKEGVSMLQDWLSVTEAKLARGQELAAKQVDPVVPAGIPTDLVAIMGIIAGAYTQIMSQYPKYRHWTPGVDLPPDPAPEEPPA